MFILECHFWQRQPGQLFGLKRLRGCAEDEGEGDDLATLAQGLSRECRIVLVSGFESFNVELYRKVCTCRTWTKAVALVTGTLRWLAAAACSSCICSDLAPAFQCQGFLSCAAGYLPAQHKNA